MPETLIRPFAPLASLNDDARYRFDLALFGPEDEGRTEEPSERKKRRAREEEGKVVNSAEVNQTASLIAGVIVIAVMIGRFSGQLQNYLRNAFSRIGEAPERIALGTIPNILADCMMTILSIMLPLLIVLIIVGLGANLAQTRFLFTMKRMKFDLKRISPGWKNFRERVFFSKQSMMNFGKIVFKVVIIAAIGIMTISSYYNKLLGTIVTNVFESAKLLGWVTFEMLLKVLAFLAVLSAIDYYFQRRQYISQLKMSKQEVKEEFKESEGDPYVKQRIQETMRKLAFTNIYRTVPEADVVITNPTHYAVALKYEMGQTAAPRVIAKGVDEIAQRIKQIAREHAVETIENVPLARALYAACEIGDEIPETFYAVVSEIFANLYRMKHKRENRASRKIS